MIDNDTMDACTIVAVDGLTLGPNQRLVMLGDTSYQSKNGIGYVADTNSHNEVLAYVTDNDLNTAYIVGVLRDGASAPYQMSDIYLGFAHYNPKQTPHHSLNSAYGRIVIKNGVVATFGNNHCEDQRGGITYASTSQYSNLNSLIEVNANGSDTRLGNVGDTRYLMGDAVENVCSKGSIYSGNTRPGPFEFGMQGWGELNNLNTISDYGTTPKQVVIAVFGRPGNLPNLDRMLVKTRPLHPPDNLTATAGDQQVTLTWPAGTHDNYTIRWRAVSALARDTSNHSYINESNSTRIDNITGTSYTPHGPDQ